MIVTLKKLLPSLLIISVLLAGCDDTPRNQAGKKATKSKTIQSAHYRNLNDIYNSFSYHWDRLDQGVPPLLLRRFPTDIHLIRPTKAKKDFFFQSILPLALLGNEEVKHHRDTINNFFKIYNTGEALALHQHEELIKIQRYYKIKGDVLLDPKIRARLIKRVDIIPPSLILAQAANESGWGMSRFAQHANNIFGEWTFTPGTGLVPEGRPAGETYEVRRFEDLHASIRSYLRNLNTHSAYRSMRNKRLQMRENDLPLTGYALAGEMRYYSTRRDAYVEEIRSMIKGNKLEELNSVALLPAAEQPATEKTPIKGGIMSSQDKISRQSKT
jgi:Bax protein